MDEEIYVGLDIGTTKIAAVIGRLDENGQMTITGVGTAVSAGLRRGVVIDIDKTVESIKKAISEAELLSGHEVTEVYAGVAGEHIRGLNSKGVIAVGGRDRIITADDVARVIDAAKAIALPTDRNILHTLPKEFIVDDQDGIKNPVGMAGTRLECEVHIVTAASSSVQNIYNCVEKAGYSVRNAVLEPLASSLSVLDDNERDLGVAIIDIGGGTTDLAVLFDGSVQFTSVIGLGGQHITSDLSLGLRTPFEHAEMIKREHGCALQSMVGPDEIVEVPGLHDRRPRQISRQVLAAIIEPRLEEMFELSLKELKKSNLYDSLGAGVVLTGGACLLPGSSELAERVLGMPVKIGIPVVSSGLVETVRSPMYATGVGLMKYGVLDSDEDTGKKKKVKPGNKGGFISKILEFLDREF
jgi:cell division protein FtsA